MCLLWRDNITLCFSRLQAASNWDLTHVELLKKWKQLTEQSSTQYPTVQYSIPHSPVLNTPQSSTQYPTVQYSITHSPVLNTPKSSTQYPIVQYSIPHNSVLNTPESSTQYPTVQYSIPHSPVLNTHILSTYLNDLHPYTGFVCFIYKDL
jgi:hypothetical protein